MIRCKHILKQLVKERWLLPFFFCCIAGCKQQPPPVGITSNIQQPLQEQARQQYFTDSVFPILQQQVQTGDVITRLGGDITSELLRRMNTQDSRFSHCGIASLEDDTLFVYHAIGGEFNPDQKIKREPLFQFGQAFDNKAIGIFRLAKQKEMRQQIAKLAKQYYHQSIPFDMQFDFKSEDRFYCAEYVAKCLIRAWQDSSWLPNSIAGSKWYIAVDNLTHNEKARFINSFKY